MLHRLWMGSAFVVVIAWLVGSGWWRDLDATPDMIADAETLRLEA